MQQHGHADDAIQGRADFMADVRQKLRFDARRFKRFVAGLGQLGLDPFAVCDVEYEGQDAAFALEIDQFGGAQAFADFPGFNAEGAFVIAQRAVFAEALRKESPVVRADPQTQIQGRAADDFLARISHQFQEAVVHVDKPAFRQSGDGNGRGAGVKRLREPLFRSAQFFFGQLPLGDVAGVDDNGLDAGFAQQIGAGAFHPMP